LEDLSLQFAHLSYQYIKVAYFHDSSSHKPICANYCVLI